MADAKATVENEQKVMRISSPMLEKMYNSGEIKLTDEELAQLDGRPMVTMSSDYESRMPKTEPLGPLEWIEPLEAVDWLAPRLGGEAQAKSAILGRLIDGRIHCTCIWTCEQPDIGPLPQLRPREVSNPSKSDQAFYVSELSTPSSVTLLGGAMWNRGEHWDEDQKRFKWAEGLFVSSFDNGVMVTSNTEDGDSQGRLLRGRIVAYGVRFNRANVEAIMAGASGVSQGVNTNDANTRSPSQAKPSPAGRKRDPDWEPWIAEVVIYAQLFSYDPSMSAAAFHRIIHQRLGERGIEGPSEEKTAKAIRAILNRWKQAVRDHEV
jgi:hypothetical protein